MVHSGGRTCLPGCPRVFVSEASLKQKQHLNGVRKPATCSNLFEENRWTPRSKFTTLSLVRRNLLDAVLLVKAFMGATELAQVTEVCFPLDGLNYLGDPPDSANSLPREPLSQRQSREFLRTADLVENTIGSWTARRSTCELWFLTMLAEALLLGQPR